MNLKQTTLWDIARELGFSAATVSRALKNSYEISEPTKKLVRECAQRLDYRPNIAAQSVRQGKSRAIGVVVPSIDNQFFSQVIDGVESVAQRMGYHLMITQNHESSEVELLNVNDLIAHAIDGLLISLSIETADVSYLRKLQKKGLPIVFYDRDCDEIDAHKVMADNFGGAFEATKQLIQKGFRRIAHITGSGNISTVAERLNGYKQALEDHSVPFNEHHIKYCPQGGRDSAEVEGALFELLHAENRPEVIFTATDKITTVALSLLHQMKFNIPDDIALFGFTNVDVAGILNPSLSVVYQPGFEMGKKAAELLIDQIENKLTDNEFEKVVLPTCIFIRDSSQYIVK